MGKNIQLGILGLVLVAAFCALVAFGAVRNGSTGECEDVQVTRANGDIIGSQLCGAWIRIGE